MQNLSDIKPILAFETSGNLCGVCVYYSDDKFFSSTINLKHSHSEKIFELTEWLFKVANINASELDSIAVSEGPGSFTGLRIGFSAAKGIAYSANIPIIPVPTFEALAYQLASIKKEDEIFIISNKVKSDEVYFAKFQIRGFSYIFVEDLTILSNEIFIKKAQDYQVFGDSAKLLNKELLYPTSPDPLFIAKWAVQFGTEKKTFEYDFMEPNYLKNFIVKEKYK